jgi:capsular exopolysaccharide synthesis family protein
MTSNIYDYFKNELGVREAFQTLRTNIQFASVDKPIQTIMITSAIPSEGKTTVALSLGISMAENGKRVIILEMDTRRPMLGNRLKQRPKYNWFNMLSGDMSIADVAVPTKVKNLFFMDIEPQMTHLVEVINSNKFSFMLQQLRNEYDVVIFDTPPLGAFIEAAVLAEKTDGSILVIGAGKVDVKKVQEVIAQLQKANAHILGVVLNGVRHSQSTYGYYSYYKNEGSPTKRSQKKRGIGIKKD